MRLLGEIILNENRTRLILETWATGTYKGWKKAHEPVNMFGRKSDPTWRTRRGTVKPREAKEREESFKKVGVVTGSKVFKCDKDWVEKTGYQSDSEGCSRAGAEGQEQVGMKKQEGWPHVTGEKGMRWVRPRGRFCLQNACNNHCKIWHRLKWHKAEQGLVARDKALWDNSYCRRVNDAFPPPDLSRIPPTFSDCCHAGFHPGMVSKGERDHSQCYQWSWTDFGHSWVENVHSQDLPQSTRCVFRN